MMTNICTFLRTKKFDDTAHADFEKSWLDKDLSEPADEPKYSFLPRFKFPEFHQRLVNDFQAYREAHTEIVRYRREFLQMAPYTMPSEEAAELTEQKQSQVRESKKKSKGNKGPKKVKGSKDVPLVIARPVALRDEGSKNEEGAEYAME